MKNIMDQYDLLAAENRAKTEPNGTSVQIGIDLLTGALWEAATERAQGAMEVKRLSDSAEGFYPCDPSAYDVTQQHVVKAYERLVQELDLPAKLLEHRGPKIQLDSSMEDILGKGKEDAYSGIVERLTKTGIA
jgi:hypothetical protein